MIELAPRFRYGWAAVADFPMPMLAQHGLQVADAEAARKFWCTPIDNLAAVEVGECDTLRDALSVFTIQAAVYAGACAALTPLRRGTQASASRVCTPS
jgi:hypothetical protein